MTQHTLEVNQLHIQRGGRSVLTVEQLFVQENEILSVIGPNGSGKSTLLLALSRLLKPGSGSILFKGQDIWRINALQYRRRIGLVLQDALLLSGSVYDNVATGLRFRKLPKKEIQQRVNPWLEKLGILHLSQRPAHALSGGEAQRVSLARSFVLQPDILMLDEPFSALDAPTRRRLLEDIQLLLKDTPITTLFVTHDMNEALLLGNRVAVLMDGELVQTGIPQQVFTNPATAQVAEFVGVETIIPARVSGSRDGMLELQADHATLSAIGTAPAGSEVFLCLRPEDITLRIEPFEADASSARNQLQGTVERLLPDGPLVRVQVQCGFPVVALITRASAEDLNLCEGIKVVACFKATAAHLIVR